jgi:hypothetical protein
MPGTCHQGHGVDRLAVGVLGSHEGKLEHDLNSYGTAGIGWIVVAPVFITDGARSFKTCKLLRK